MHKYRPLKAELIVHYILVYMSHVTFILHDQVNNLPSSLP